MQAPETALAETPPHSNPRRAAAVEVPFVPWKQFREEFARQWVQGEHVTIIGPTGEGKTELAIRLLTLRRWVVVFGVKGRDKTLDQLIRAGYLRLKEWCGDLADYVVLWPAIRGAEHWKEQRAVFAEAMGAIYRAGGWCVVFDEVTYMARFLRMERELEFLLQQGRSSGISVVAMTQRPAFIPLAFYDQQSHVIFFKDPDMRNIERIAEFTGQDRRQTRKLILSLRKHEFVYYNKSTGRTIRSMVEV